MTTETKTARAKAARAGRRIRNLRSKQAAYAFACLRETRDYRLFHPRNRQPGECYQSTYYRLLWKKA